MILNYAIRNPKISGDFPCVCMLLKGNAITLVLQFKLRWLKEYKFKDKMSRIFLKKQCMNNLLL